VYLSIYLSKSQYDDRIQPPIDSCALLVSSADFNIWFDLPVLESSGNIIEQVYLYLMQKSGMYPGTLLFGDDWESDNI
jgi:hypothetical protein